MTKIQLLTLASAIMYAASDNKCYNELQACVRAASDIYFQVQERVEKEAASG